MHTSFFTKFYRTHFLQLFVATALLLGTISCETERSQEQNFATVTVNVQHRVGSTPLVINEPIVNPHGEPWSVSAFSYYIANFELLDLVGNPIKTGGQYFLIQEKLSSSKTFAIAVEPGAYSGIRFTIGVDSVRNVSGIQTGSLDPANGMFWSWNTGYIFAKLEGKSSLSTAPLQNVTYHIGGFKRSESALQTVSIAFPAILEPRLGNRPTINLSADVNKWFTGSYSIKIAENAFVMTPGLLAQQIAANYANMFIVESVSN